MKKLILALGTLGVVLMVGATALAQDQPAAAGGGGAGASSPGDKLRTP